MKTKIIISINVLKFYLFNKTELIIVNRKTRKEYFNIKIYSPLLSNLLSNIICLFGYGGILNNFKQKK